MDVPEAAPTYYEYLPMTAATDEEIVTVCVGYFDAEAAGYDEYDRRVPRRAAYLGAVDDRVVQAISRLDTCRNVLSFGCGTGRREQAIAARVPSVPSVLGIEPSRSMAAVAASRGIRSIPRPDAPGAPLPASVDVVLCLYTFFHLPGAARRATMRYFAQTLRPGGLLMLDVFNRDDRYGGGVDPAPLAACMRDGDVLYRRRGREHVSFMHYFTVGEISALIEESGLRIVEIVGVGHGRDPGRVGVPFTEGCLLVTATMG